MFKIIIFSNFGLIASAHFGINIGTIDYDNVIKASKMFEDTIIPISFTNNHTNNSGSVIIYFEIHQVYTDDSKRFKQYCLLC